jgi:nucleotide-binding universal stress UspA family protein
MTSPRSSADGAVGVGVNGSRNSIAALRRADRQARRRLSALEIVYVIHPGAGAAEAAAARDLLRQTVRAALPDGPRVLAGRRVERGEPADILVQLSNGAELLVIGSRDIAGYHVLGGPTVSHCLDYAFCPVDICADHAAHAGRADQAAHAGRAAHAAHAGHAAHAAHAV